MSYNDATKDEIRKAVRDVLAVNPLASSRSIAGAVSKRMGTKVGYDYIQRLIRKATGEAQKEMELKIAVPQLARMAERYRMMIESLQTEFYETNPDTHKPVATFRDRIAAARAITYMERTLFVSMMDAGIFARHRGIDDTPKEKPEDAPESIEAMAKALRNWGIIDRPAEQIEAPIMEDATVVESENGEQLSTTEQPPKIFQAGAVDIDDPPRDGEKPHDPRWWRKYLLAKTGLVRSFLPPGVSAATIPRFAIPGEFLYRSFHDRDC